MTKADLIAGKAFYYKGHFHNLQKLNPLKNVDGVLIDKNGAVAGALCELETDWIYSHRRKSGQVEPRPCFKVEMNGFGRIVILFDECIMEEQIIAFLTKFQEMRRAQNDFFKSKNNALIPKAKKLELELDKEAEQIKAALTVK